MVAIIVCNNQRENFDFFGVCQDCDCLFDCEKTLKKDGE